MNEQQQQRSSQPASAASNSPSRYDYGNAGLPRDFDIRIEVAEQQEVVKQSQKQCAAYRWKCSEYDF